MTKSPPAPIGLNPDQPLTGGRRENMSAEMNDLVVAKHALFEAIYLPEPRQLELHSRLDLLMKTGVASRGKPQRGIRVLAPSGSGKTTAAERFMDLKASDDVNHVPIVLVKLDRATTPRRMISSILDEFGDEYADKGTEALLRKRMYVCMERLGTELLIIDEVQHLDYRSSEKSDVTDTLKRLLDDGVVPIAFLGTDEAKDLFRRNLQLNGRLMAPCDLRPLDRNSQHDRSLFASFVLQLDTEIVQRGIFTRAAGLAHTGIRGALAEVSKGVIGRVSRLLHSAIEIAVRRGAECLEVYDLSLATERWAIEQGFVEDNPFRRLPQTQ